MHCSVRRPVGRTCNLIIPKHHGYAFLPSALANAAQMEVCRACLGSLSQEWMLTIGNMVLREMPKTCLDSCQLIIHLLDACPELRLSCL